jgi:hypothetical protein
LRIITKILFIIIFKNRNFKRTLNYIFLKYIFQFNKKKKKKKKRKVIPITGIVLSKVIIKFGIYERVVAIPKRNNFSIIKLENYEIHFITHYDYCYFKALRYLSSNTEGFLFKNKLKELFGTVMKF